MTTTIHEKARESRLRRIARRQGLALRKSRLRGPTHIDDQGGWMIVNPFNNTIVVGEKFDWSLDDVERYLSEE